MAAGDVLMHVGQGIGSSGHLLAGSDETSLLMRAADLTLTSEGHPRASGSLLSDKNINLNGWRVDISQSQLAAGRTTLSTGSGGVVLRQTTVDSGMRVINTAGSIDARQAQVRAGQWDVTGNNLFSQKAVWPQTGDAESRFVLHHSPDKPATVMGDDIIVRARIIDNHGRDAVMAATATLHLNTVGRIK
ncbi:hemagglutinin [Erwinia amylovora]|uniref:hemagglutinin n=1 Tax=Erwinia amylovora TaxID=552 RepID=UPI001F040430|nr:hemagglutinin [Erwinia amylovora]